MIDYFARSASGDPVPRMDRGDDDGDGVGDDIETQKLNLTEIFFQVDWK